MCIHGLHQSDLVDCEKQPAVQNPNEDGLICPAYYLSCFFTVDSFLLIDIPVKYCSDSLLLPLMHLNHLAMRLKIKWREFTCRQTLTQ